MSPILPMEKYKIRWRKETVLLVLRLEFQKIDRYEA